MSRVVLVTGGNRGIGLEVVRELAARGETVLLGSRDVGRGRAAAEGLAGVLPRQLDVTDQGSVDRLAAEAAGEFGRLDVLVNNAAIDYDTWQQATAADLGVVAEALDTNLLGAWRVALAFLPQLRRSAHPRLVNVSSEAGSLTNMGGGVPAYRASKPGSTV